ncbi:MAG: rhodanese-like domain-containing protein [Rickettsiales bacterium]|nr:rhodanese-like domain-containing protein [Rickettsiales bacterium]
MNELLSNDIERYLEADNSYLIDVRTPAEWQFVGCPDLGSFKSKYVQIPIFEYPEMSFNNDFQFQIKSIENINKDSILLFICRSGVRSRKAAEIAENLGYQNIYNISDGFEGDVDEQCHRGNISGWKHSRLPWKQS